MVALQAEGVAERQRTRKNLHAPLSSGGSTGHSSHAGASAGCGSAAAAETEVALGGDGTDWEAMKLVHAA